MTAHRRTPGPVPPAPNGACPRCGADAGCGAGGPAPCWCVEHTLSRETLDGLRERYAGCLCPACLAEAATGAARPA